MNIYVYTQTTNMKQIAQLDMEDLELLKATFHIFGHTYRELNLDGNLIVFLTPSPLTDDMCLRIAGEFKRDMMILKPGERIWLEISG